jgi:hypothetical protein
MSNELEQVAAEVADEKWERQWGYGIHHTSADVQAQARKVALVEVEKWFKLLQPAFEAQEDARIRKVNTTVEVDIDDSWGDVGDTVREYFLMHILDRRNS